MQIPPPPPLPPHTHTHTHTHTQSKDLLRQAKESTNKQVGEQAKEYKSNKRCLYYGSSFLYIQPCILKEKLFRVWDRLLIVPWFRLAS